MRRFGTTTICILLLFALCGCAMNPTAPPPEEVRVPITTPIPTPQVTTVPEGDDLTEIAAIEPQDRELVRLKEFLPELTVDLRYATTDNFTGSKVYDFRDAWLRYGTVKKLAAAAALLEQEGYTLLIWDAYRPTSAQRILWNAKPDEKYVANPYKNGSSHSGGGTVDLTLLGPGGASVEMPSGFDNFSALADRDYSDVSAEAAEHAALLESAMTEAGFYPYAAEWWHYQDSALYTADDLADVLLPANEGILYTPDCEDYITLRAAPDTKAEELAHIPVGSAFSLLGFCGSFARIAYGSQQGYVLLAYIKVLR